ESDGGAELAQRLGEAQYAAGEDAGGGERQGHGGENEQRPRPQRAGGLFEPAVEAFDGEADGAHHQRQAHDGGGKGSTGPTEGENEAAALIEEAAYRSLAAEREKQQIAGDDRRHDQGQMNDPIEQGPAGKPAARQDISERHAERQRNDRGDTRHPEAQKNGGPVRIR